MLTINAKIRKDQGKGASRRLRLKNKFPAIVYGGAEAPIAIELDHDIILHTQTKKDFYRDVLALVIDGKARKVEVQAVQRHPFKPKLTHIDFVRV
ncbi:50S ribosomal protein L25 [secondary endosymbiont of Ctenarytaina eucalypti]|uniref:Large ribosomal subunit protein bL25 n=1 Tax=secondary endosymbiont of Ctenarytaina eucalypti TaxID=1199245 RepID=J3VRQ2_9ENTR|nr:50S ribosomal protein L25 [secondary endosymbiont of Ctenarytaina eucalypti]AFP84651.1 ribosomal protein L25 (general stress protein Ctc) [secondary endosymbiont of Ctenarytaina eucalypti]